MFNLFKGLSPIDRELLDLLQEGLPLVSRPFARIGEMIGLSEEEVLERLKVLFDKGIVRHLGASIDSRRLGFVTTLCAVSAPRDRAEKLAHVIAKHREVTHCYLRRHRLNIWFTVVARHYHDVKRILKEIEKEIGLSPKHFPAKKMFKLRATFCLSNFA